MSDVTVFGDGAVVIDNSGITILAPEDFNEEIIFVAENGTEIGSIDAGYDLSGDSGLKITGNAKTSSERGFILLQAYNNDQSVIAQIVMQSNGNLYHVYRAGTQDIHRGKAERYLKVATTTETSIATYLIAANAMGTTGRIHLRAYILIKNNKGSAGTYDFTFYFGTKSFMMTASPSINNSATTRSIEIIDIEVVNAGATNAQIITARHDFLRNVAAEISSARTTNAWWTTAAIDTTADVTCKLTIDLSVTDAAFFSESSGGFSGPYPPLA